MITNKICNKKDFDQGWFPEMCMNIVEAPKYHRKQWEFVMMAKALEERGLLVPGNKGLGFGVGTEPLPAYFASKGCEILATDQAITNDNAKNWIGSSQLCTSLQDLNNRRICPDDLFKRNVKFRNVDMNYIPADMDYYDFVWSSCALEHLGTLQNGLWFIMRTAALLMPGGVAVHTTEFNLSSNNETNTNSLNNIYREQDIDALIQTIRGLGLVTADPDYTRGKHNYDLYVDNWAGGWNDGSENKPHLNLKVDGFDATSLILIIEKPL